MYVLSCAQHGLAEKAESVSLYLGNSAVEEESLTSFATSRAMNGYKLLSSAGHLLTEISLAQCVGCRNWVNFVVRTCGWPDRFCCPLYRTRLIRCMWWRTFPFWGPGHLL